MMKRFLHILIGLMPLFLMVSLIYWIVMTPAGLNFIAQTITPFVPGQLVIHQATGTLNHQIHLSKVSYKNNLILFNANSIDITWQPLQFINHNNLAVNDIVIKSGAIHINTIKSNKPSNWPRIPFNIQLDKLFLQQFNILYGQQNFKHQ